MSETDNNPKKDLYREAFYWHFINQGYSEWRAQEEAGRIIGEKI